MTRLPASLTASRAIPPARGRSACSTPKKPAKASACSSIAARSGRGHWLAGTSPAGPRRASRARCSSRATSLTSGRLFFNSPDDLVPQATNAQGERLRVRAGGRRQLRKPHRRVRVADLLGQLGQGIGVPRSDAERQRRVLPDRGAAAAAGHRHGVRHLRRARLHASRRA